MSKIKLSPGDAIYFERHLAYAVLLRRAAIFEDRPRWVYCLRSPKRSDLDNHLVSIQSHREDQIIDSIASGDFVHIKGKLK